jgi:hypothetical protein
MAMGRWMDKMFIFILYQFANTQYGAQKYFKINANQARHI